MTRGPQDLPTPALLVDLSIRLGGASIRAAELVRGGSSRGWVLSSLDESPVTRYARDRGIPLITLAARRVDPRILPRLVRVIREKGIQLVDGQNPQSKFWGAWAAQRTGTAFVATLNSWPLAEYGSSLRGILYHLLERALRPSTDLHIVVSAEIEQALLDDGVPPSRIARIPAAIDTNAVTLIGNRPDIRQDLGISGEATLCCSVGRLVTAKGFAHLIDAIAALARESCDICCLIVGDGPLRDALQSRATKLGLEKKVRFLGFRPRDQVLAILAACDIFVMPSLTEGTPVAILEAASLARPIVASNVGGIPSMLTNGEHAMLIPPADPGRLAKAISDLCRRREHAQTLGLQAREHVRVHFNLERQVEATYHAYGRALAHHAGKSHVQD